MNENTIGRETVANWMMLRGYATGHGDTIQDLLFELEGQLGGERDPPPGEGDFRLLEERNRRLEDISCRQQNEIGNLNAEIERLKFKLRKIAEHPDTSELIRQYAAGMLDGTMTAPQYAQNSALS